MPAGSAPSRREGSGGPGAVFRAAGGVQLKKTPDGL
jgi:hypothetical protein